MDTEEVFQPNLAKIVDRYRDREICLVASEHWNLAGTGKGVERNALTNHLREKGVAFLRVAAVGRLVQSEPIDELFKTKALMIFNRLDDGRSIPAFAEMVRGHALKEGAVLMLHRFAGGLTKLVVIQTNQRLKIYPNLESAIAEYCALTRNDVEFESLGRLRDFQNSPWMAALIAQNIGEVS